MPRRGALAFTANVRANFLDRAKFKALFDKANQIALTKCGVRVRDGAKKGIGNSPPHVAKSRLKKAKADDLKRVADGLYLDLSRASSAGHKPRPPGKPIKSWAPRRFVYNSIRFYWDNWRGSVVIGPDREPWLNQLHEFGGSRRLVAVVSGEDAARRARAIRDRGGKIPTYPNGVLSSGYLRWVSPGGKPSKNGRRIGMMKAIRYPARPFMQGSAYVRRALERIDRDFAGTLSGRVGAGETPPKRIA